MWALPGFRATAHPVTNFCSACPFAWCFTNVNHANKHTLRRCAKLFCRVICLGLGARVFGVSRPGSKNVLDHCAQVAWPARQGRKDHQKADIGRTAAELCRRLLSRGTTPASFSRYQAYNSAIWACRRPLAAQGGAQGREQRLGATIFVVSLSSRSSHDHVEYA